MMPSLLATPKKSYLQDRLVGLERKLYWQLKVKFWCAVAAGVFFFPAVFQILTYFFTGEFSTLFNPGQCLIGFFVGLATALTAMFTAFDLPKLRDDIAYVQTALENAPEVRCPACRGEGGDHV